ncbi:hypothetical protein SOVF_166720, partial [Spinacia oleracea]
MIKHMMMQRQMLATVILKSCYPEAYYEKSCLFLVVVVATAEEYTAVRWPRLFMVQHAALQ